jgi:hypothetical protein
MKTNEKTKLTLWGRAIHEKLIIAQPVTKFSALYGTGVLITVFTKACLYLYLEPDESSPQSHTLLL